MRCVADGGSQSTDWMCASNLRTEARLASLFVIAQAGLPNQICIFRHALYLFPMQQTALRLQESPREDGALNARASTVGAARFDLFRQFVGCARTYRAMCTNLSQ